VRLIYPQKTVSAAKKRAFPSLQAGMESSNITLKVALLGPRESGKTRIARQLQGNSVTDDDPYVPTAAVRIVEMDRQFTAWTRDGKRSNEVKCKVELWDCSGDSKVSLPAHTHTHTHVCVCVCVCV
jgi:GTPase SAR1 family protein